MDVDVYCFDLLNRRYGRLCEASRRLGIHVESVLSFCQPCVSYSSASTDFFALFLLNADNVVY